MYGIIYKVIRYFLYMYYLYIFKKPLNRSEESVGEVDDAANRSHDEPDGTLAQSLNEPWSAALLSAL